MVDAWLLRLLRVPERPDPPPGTPSTITAFRASENYLRYLLLGWGIRQFFAAVGLIVSFFFLGLLEGAASPTEWLERMGRADAAEELSEAGEELVEEVPPLRFAVGLLDRAVATRFFDSRIEVLSFIEKLAVVGFLVQLVTGWFLIRLRWRMRWYFVGDRALRIREGIWTLSEKTMTLANIQNLRISQGPLQKLFGFADLEVKTAGGGGSEAGESTGDDLHLAVMKGLANVEEVRDRIRRAQALSRTSGLGDPDEDDMDRENTGWENTDQENAVDADAGWSWEGGVDDAATEADIARAPTRLPDVAPVALEGAARQLAESARELRRELERGLQS